MKSGDPKVQMGTRSRLKVLGSAKTLERAVAAASIHLQPETFEALERGGAKQVDVLATARLAGVQAARRTFELLPLCHTIALADVDLELLPDRRLGIVAVRAAAQGNDRGAEMQALVAVATAALTIYCMLRSSDREMAITDVELVEKPRWQADGRTGRRRYATRRMLEGRKRA